MKSFIPIFDAGHGGMIGGQYQTPGKRSPNWKNGILYEGAFNRWIVNALMKACDLKGIPYFHISPELSDTPLHTRANRANRIYQDVQNVYVLSIHANAGGGTGFEGFTSRGKTQSDDIGEIFLKAVKKSFPEIKFRSDLSDGDLDKEAGFKILRSTRCPAFLLECLFMDHKKDYAYLWSEDFHCKLVDCLMMVIEQLYKG